MMMMHSMKMFHLLPMIPAFFVFGVGMITLHYAKKEHSRLLRYGGLVMSIGAGLIILVLLVMLGKGFFHNCGGGHKGMMMGGGYGPGGGYGCTGEMCGETKNQEGPQPMQQAPAPAQPERPMRYMMKHHK